MDVGVSIAPVDRARTEAPARPRAWFAVAAACVGSLVALHPPRRACADTHGDPLPLRARFTVESLEEDGAVLMVHAELDDGASLARFESFFPPSTRPVVRLATARSRRAGAVSRPLESGPVRRGRVAVFSRPPLPADEGPFDVELTVFVPYAEQEGSDTLVVPLPGLRAALEALEVIGPAGQDASLSVDGGAFGDEVGARTDGRSRRTWRLAHEPRMRFLELAIDAERTARGDRAPAARGDEPTSRRRGAVGRVPLDPRAVVASLFLLAIVVARRQTIVPNEPPRSKRLHRTRVILLLAALAAAPILVTTSTVLGLAAWTAAVVLAWLRPDRGVRCDRWPPLDARAEPPPTPDGTSPRPRHRYRAAFDEVLGVSLRVAAFAISVAVGRALGETVDDLVPLRDVVPLLALPLVAIRRAGDPQASAPTSREARGEVDLRAAAVDPA